MGRSSIGRWRLGEQFSMDTESGRSIKRRVTIRRGERKEKMIIIFHSWGRLVNQSERGYRHF
jgi:hypothetical protein